MKTKLIFTLSFYPLFGTILILLNSVKPSTHIFDYSLVVSTFIFAAYSSFLYIKKKLNPDLAIFILVMIMALSQFGSGMLLNIDRSRSFFVLSWIDKYHIKYVNQHAKLNLIQSAEAESQAAIDLRIREQIDRKLVSINHGELKLTGAGKTILMISNITAEIFNLDGWKKNNY